MQQPRIIFVSGLSGAGKSTAAHALEDLQYWCIDNLPSALVPKLLALAVAAGGQIDRLAVVCDARDSTLGEVLPPLLDDVRRQRWLVDLLFLEAADDVLARRFERTGRRHPLAGAGRDIEQALASERQLLQSVRDRATQIIDTSAMTPHQLRQAVVRRSDGSSEPWLELALLGFGFPQGIPPEVDIVIDLRCLPDPTLEPALAGCTGMDPQVRQHVFRGEAPQRLVERAVELLAFLFPLFQREGKSYLTVGLGCSDGVHRSVACAAEVQARLRPLGIESRLHIPSG
ncbi:MAG: RNase adapter RapZ [Deltaproteobacteria bacterium]|nr:RNase adapter RapZ [Deltaproteobacteria bacterium]